MLTISTILNTDPPQVTAHMLQIQIIINIKKQPTTKIKTKQNNPKGIVKEKKEPTRCS
jgi:hypothetical protein